MSINNTSSTGIDTSADTENSATVIAQPPNPQQLFLIFPDPLHTVAHWQALAQSLAENFPQGLVAIVPATPTSQGLRRQVQQWQTQTALNFERTALIAVGAAAGAAITAVTQYADLCARLFAAEGWLEKAAPIPDTTTVHWLQGQANADLLQHASNAVEMLKQHGADCTLEALPASTHEPTEQLQQRIMHLLQNYVPRRIWREALERVDT